MTATSSQVQEVRVRLSERTEFLLHGTPHRRRRFLALLERLPAAQRRALWRGVVAADDSIEVAVAMDDRAVEDIEVATVTTMKRLMATDPVPTPKPTGYCHTCGAELPSAERPKGGRPPIYCPGTGCAPSRSLADARDHRMPIRPPTGSLHLST